MRVSHLICLDYPTVLSTFTHNIETSEDFTYFNEKASVASVHAINPTNEKLVSKYASLNPGYSDLTITKKEL